MSQPERQYPNVGVYEHYKSTPEDRRYYEVMNFAKHTETDETLVIYAPLYDTEHSDSQLVARPLDMFMEEVEVDGQKVPRFRYIGPKLTVDSA